MKLPILLLLCLLSIQNIKSQDFETIKFEVSPAIGDALFVDLNGDGTNEILGRESFFDTYGLHVWEITDQSPLEFEHHEIVPEGGVYLSYLAHADMDNDGDQDIIVSTGENKVTTILYNESTVDEFIFTPHTLNFSGAEEYQVFDFDDDGDQDIFIRTDDEVYYLIQSSLNNFLEVSLGAFTDPQRFKAVDYDSDGNTDLVIADIDKIYLSRNLGSNFIRITMDDDFVNTTDIDFGDMNNDGHMDILISRVGVHIYENQGSGNNWIKHKIDYTSSGITVSDINNDGILDVACGGDFEEQCKIFIASDDAFNYNIHDLSGYRDVDDVLPADLDNDGDDDFLIISPGHLDFFYALNSLVLGTKNVEYNNFEVYPNPASETIKIENELSLNHNSKISIYSLEGKMVHESYFSTSQIDITGLQDGRYTIQISSDDSVYTSSFIKADN